MVKNTPHKIRGALLIAVMMLMLAVLMLWNLDYTSDKIRVVTDRDKYMHTEPVQVVQGRVNINLASVQTLMMIDSIGEKTAAAIVEYRNTNGEFSDIYEIMNVKDIGPDTFEKIKNYICVK